ncbi:MAG: thiamine pyrophosphate-dependent enzyme [Planctomycetota bacterium]|jgi:2-oxoisovalerate dehydrogenase E1 component
MAIRREAQVAERLLAAIRGHGCAGSGPQHQPEDPVREGSTLTRAVALQLYECALQSRLQDLETRRLKDRGLSYYTIGSSGHEANVVFGHLLRLQDPCFLHYRSGAMMAARARLADPERGRETSIHDTMLAMVAAADDPTAGGRHKVFGSRQLWVPPQTSTIASHLPKAVGLAYALARLERLGLSSPVPADSIVYCSFGDASVNHATAQAGFNAAAAAVMQRQPCPILFVCEDNGLGISVHTPRDYIEDCFRDRPGLDWFAADGRDLCDTFDKATTAIHHCRQTRRPVFFHLRTVRLLGHAGSDVETTYLTPEQITANEELDPLIAFADLLLSWGAIGKEELLEVHETLELRIREAGEKATAAPKLKTAAAVMEPLALPAPDQIEPRIADRETRMRIFGGQLPEDGQRPRHLAFRIAQGLEDLMAAYPNMFVFGMDVSLKGGVYHVTDGLHNTYGAGRVFNTILDETTILGLAQGMAHAGCLPVPEIQYLAYIHNALDQIRGEAASLKFFSKGQFQNPMVVRVASFAYQKGFGGHFHNDNSIGALLDIPGLILAAPSRADDAVGMLRTCAAAASQHGIVCVFLEPIALYMEKDLHEKGDGQWQFRYPPPAESVPLGRARVYDPKPEDCLTILSYANGLHMSLQAQRHLQQEGVPCRVVDLRWLAPLPWEDIREHAVATGRVLVVDECRRTGGGPSALILSELCDQGLELSRICGEDTYIPLGPAMDTVLVQVQDIVQAATKLANRGANKVT